MQVTSSWYQIKTLPTMAKAGIVAGGYVAAILLAFGVVFIYINFTSGPYRDASSGMYAFGDSLFFIAVFGVVSTIPTGLALVFLRQSRMFWIALCVVALVVASTSLAAVAVIMWESQTFMPSASLWPGLSAIRLFVSPFIAASVGLSALLALDARFRKYLFGAATTEGVSSVYGFFHWFALLFFR
jgi:hypothetical protein